MIDRLKKPLNVILLLTLLVVVVWLTPHTLAHADLSVVENDNTYQSSPECLTPILPIVEPLEFSQFSYPTDDYIIFNVLEWNGDDYERQYYSVPKKGEEEPFLFYDSRVDSPLWRWIENESDNTVTVTTAESIWRMELGGYHAITMLYESSDNDSEIRAYAYHFVDNTLLFQTENLDLYHVELTTSDVTFVTTLDMPVEILPYGPRNFFYLRQSSSLYYLELNDGLPHLITDQFRRLGRITEEYAVYFGYDAEGVVTIYSFSADTYNVEALSTGLNLELHFIQGAFRNFIVTSDVVIYDAWDEDRIFEVYRANLDGGVPLRLLESTIHPGTDGDMNVSPNEDYLVYRTDYGLYSVPIDGSAEPIWIATVTPGYPYFSYGFSNGGNDVTYTTQDGRFRVPITGGDQTLIPQSYPRLADNELILWQSVYIQPIFTIDVQPIGNPDERNRLVETEYDYQYGPSYVHVPNREAIVYRQFDGENSTIYRLDGEAILEPVQLGCPFAGHLRFHDLLVLDDIPIMYFSTQEGLFRLELD